MRWGENPTSQSLRRGLLEGAIHHRTGPRQSEAAAGLGADSGGYPQRRNRAGFEPCVRVASPRVPSLSISWKRGTMGCPRRGSNPARQNDRKKPDPRRAEIFAPLHTRPLTS